jgi:hypothetical protein
MVKDLVELSSVSLFKVVTTFRFRGTCVSFKGGILVTEVSTVTGVVI